MQIKRFVASSLAALMAGATFAGAALAATSVGGVLKTLGTQAAAGTPYLVVVGDTAAASDVVGAIDVASALAQQVTKEVAVPGVSVATLTGGVSLDTADTKLYLGDAINKAIKTLTGNDLKFLGKSSITDKNSVAYDYYQYLTIGDKTIQYAQPDVASGLKDPTYLIKLDTQPAIDKYLLDAWVTFTKPFDATLAVGKELKLFGKTFTISADTSSSQLVLYGVAEKVSIGPGEEKTVTVGGTAYKVKLIGIIDDKSAVLEVNGIQKEVTEGNTYDFGGTSVYVSDVFYYKLPTESGSVVVSIGADRYVLQDGQPISYGTSGNEQAIDGTLVKFTGDPTKLSRIDIYFDAYVASPAVDYIKAGSAFTVPVFGFKVAYNGPASVPSEQITVQAGGTNYYIASFTDKYGKSGSLQWAYSYKDNNNWVVELADSLGNVIHAVEGEPAALNEYVFVAAKDFPHILKVAYLNIPATPTSDSKAKVTLKDVFSGTEYSVESTYDTSTHEYPSQQLVIDGQTYTVGFVGNKIKIEDDDGRIAIYPVMITKYGAKVALTESLTDKNIVASTITTPTGDIVLDSTNCTLSNEVTVGKVTYIISGTYSNSDKKCTLSSIKIKAGDTEINKPALLIVEEPRSGDKDGHAIILQVSYDDSSDNRLELQTPIFTDGTRGVGTSSDKVTHFVDAWGTKLVYDTTGAGTATITYPDSQVYHLVAVGENPSWTTAATEAGTYKTYAPLSLPVAKLASEVTSADKTNANIVLVGGPCANSLVQALVDAGKLDASMTCAGGTPGPAWTPGAAYVKVVEDAFATGKIALVVAGTNAADTRLATSLLSQGKLEDQTASGVKVSGTVTAPVVTPM
jgi:hypothetical protein